jgi:CheY-like chemotaxis protein
LMTTAVESIMPLATAADQQVEVRLPPTPLQIEGDSARLVQIFSNLLNNAVKFTPRGGAIWFTADRESNEAVVRVRDTGVGIPADALPRVFDMFQQAEPILERSSGGLGIGLTLARRLVEMHGGRIAIASPGAGQGTDVEIRLPVTRAQVSTPAVPEPPEPRIATRALKVLIVEDNADAAEMLELLVTDLGHTAKVAHDGPAGIAMAVDFAPDVVFLDIGLPGMSGYAVARTLRSLPAFSTVYIAAVTGWGQDEDRKKARDAGFDSHFTKPLSPAVLTDLLAGIARGAVSGIDAFSTPRTRLTDSGRSR